MLNKADLLKWKIENEDKFEFEKNINLSSYKLFYNYPEFDLSFLQENIHFKLLSNKEFIDNLSKIIKFATIEEQMEHTFRIKNAKWDCNYNTLYDIIETHKKLAKHKIFFKIEQPFLIFHNPRMSQKYILLNVNDQFYKESLLVKMIYSTTLWYKFLKFNKEKFLFLM